MNFLISAIFLSLLHYSFAFILSQSKSTGEFCENENCREIGAEIASVMNRSINPCEDFFEFTCGNFGTKYEIPDSISSLGVMEQVGLRLESQMKVILEEFEVPVNGKISNVVRIVDKLYQQCTESEGGQLADLMKDVFHRDWQLGRELDEKRTVHPWFEYYTEFVTKTGISPIFDLTVIPDDKNVTRNILTFDTVDLGLGDKDLVNKTLSPENVQAYETYIENTARLFCDDCQDETIKKDVQDLISFETRIASLKMAQEKKRSNAEESYTKLTILDFNNQTDFDWFDNLLYPVWTRMTKGQVSENIDLSTEIIVTDKEFFQKIADILQETPIRTVENYLFWIFIQKTSPFADEEFRNATFEFQSSISGITKQKELWQVCQSMIATDKTLIWPISRLWLDKHFTAREKEEASKLVDKIQDSYAKIIEEKVWLDKETKAEAISKLKHITKNIGYPDWLLNDKELDSHLGFQDSVQNQRLLSQPNYLALMAIVRTMSDKMEFSRLFTTVDPDKSWSDKPFIVNAAYSAQQNSITIPAGQLVKPFFNSDYPASLNYGNLGATVGHELSHSLDDDGRDYDLNGNLVSWWTEYSANQYDNRTECFVEQYSSIVEPRTGMNLDGKHNLGENIADNGGINEAYAAFLQQMKTASKPELKLKELAEYSPEQLFFIAYGYSWCTVSRVEAIENLIKYDAHPPEKYRVNIPLSNSPAFSRVFNCPTGAPMNPADKCVLW